MNIKNHWVWYSCNLCVCVCAVIGRNIILRHWEVESFLKSWIRWASHSTACPAQSNSRPYSDPEPRARKLSGAVQIVLKASLLGQIACLGSFIIIENLNSVLLCRLPRGTLYTWNWTRITPMLFSSALVLWHVRQGRYREKAKLNCFFALLSAIRTLGSHIWSLKLNFFISKLERVPVLPWQRVFLFPGWKRSNRH